MKFVLYIVGLVIYIIGLIVLVPVVCYLMDLLY